MFQRIRHNSAGNVVRPATASGQLDGQTMSSVSASPPPPLQNPNAPAVSPGQHRLSQISSQINPQNATQMQMLQPATTPPQPPSSQQTQQLQQQQQMYQQQQSSITSSAGQQLPLQNMMQSNQNQQNVSSSTNVQQSKPSSTLSQTTQPIAPLSTQQPQMQPTQNPSIPTQPQSQTTNQPLPQLSASQATSLPKQHKLHSIIHTNPIVRYFHITRFTGTMGPELAWQMYDAQRISDNKVSNHGDLTSVQGLPSSLVVFLLLLFFMLS